MNQGSLEGETLEERLKEKGKLPPDEVVRLAGQALQALEHLHEKGMVHRDVKPGNFMLVSLPGGATAENPYAVKLLDVGLGRALFADDDDSDAVKEDLTTTGAMIGTPDCTAPEQSRDSHAADIRSDLYGLGCTLYECLAGEAPFPEKNLLNKFLQHAQEMPPPLDLGAYPRAAELQAWLWKLLAKHPAECFQTPAEAAAALQLLANEAPLSLDAAPSERNAPQALRPRDSRPPGSRSTDGSIARVSRLRDSPPWLPPEAQASTSRQSPWKLAAIGSAALVLLLGATYFVISALSGAAK